ncbi:BglG family transcription antiterminator [Enterococcus gallinarum]|uniref:BglG family transcription antiterminator n=1 Tax=Enterococcus gallinarum TaxID=1353 RepID=UPI00189C46D4|nr:BglG family transcription antiterminator [Enterococcus gallinarum]
MIDQRTLQLIQKMIQKPLMEQEEIMRFFSLSKNQLDYAIRKINELLKANKQPLIRSDPYFIQLAPKAKAFFLNDFLNGAVYTQYEMNSEERKKYIFLMLFYYESDYLSVNHFLSALRVGKTTFMADMKKLEKELSLSMITIGYTRKNGYGLIGNEENLRNFFMKMMFHDFGDNQEEFVYHYFLVNEKIDGFSQVEGIAREKLKTFSLELVENRLNEFSYLFTMILPRLNKQWQDFYETYNYQTFFQMKEYLFAKELLMEFGITNKSAQLYICGWLLGMALGDTTYPSADFSIIHELVERIIKRFELLSGIRFKDKQKVINQLYSHFRPAYYRLFFQLPIINPLHKKIIEEYEDLYQIVQETLRPIGNLFERGIPEDEVSFLTIHFASLINDFDEYQVNQKIGVIVCPNGIGSSAMIYNELKMIFPDIIFIGPIETKELLLERSECDLIFTTVPNVSLYTLKKPVYVVNPIMTNEERNQLIQEVYHQPSEAISLIGVEELMAVIKKHATIEDDKSLKKELQLLLTRREVNPAYSATLGEERKPVALIDMLNPQYILTNIKVRSWEEAFYLAATPLIKDQVISRGYIDTIIQNVRKEGPFFIIMDQVALPHARPEEGALKLGLGITVLQEPVIINKKASIKYIFTLSAIDHSKHLSAIAELVALLEQESFFNLLEQEADPQQIFDWIASFLLKNKHMVPM